MACEEESGFLRSVKADNQDERIRDFDIASDAGEIDVEMKKEVKGWGW